MWFSSGRLTNPAANAVLVDTGPLPENTVNLLAVCASTVACAVEVQHRDAANLVTLDSQILACPLSGMSAPLTILNLVMAENERIRTIQVAAVTGFVSVSLVT